MTIVDQPDASLKVPSQIPLKRLAEPRLKTIPHRYENANRIMTWNLCEGLFQPGTACLTSGKFTIDLARQQAAIELVQQLSPDVLVLNEALCCESFAGVIRHYAEIFEFEYSATRLYDHAWGNAILSHYPIIREHHTLIHPTGSGQNRGALAARIAFPKSAVWIATLHPHPRRRPIKRSEDFENFLKWLDHPLILAGDFNAISPLDPIDLPKLERAFERFSQPGDAKAAIERFLQAGKLLFEEIFPRFQLQDILPPDSRSGTIPTTFLQAEQDSSIRIDHILTSPDITVLNASVSDNPLANLASDHYPVWADFVLQ